MGRTIALRNLSPAANPRVTAKGRVGIRQPRNWEQVIRPLDYSRVSQQSERECAAEGGDPRIRNRPNAYGGVVLLSL